jgi:NhaP-type Na+/H+ or K+/H+ antiporter
MAVSEKLVPAKQSARSAVTPYLWLVVSIGALALISNGAGDEILQRLTDLKESPPAPILAAATLFGLCSFASAYATWRTPLPSFVVAIALGIAGHKLFAPIVARPTLLATLVTGSAAIILFGGGLEMPLRSFLRLLVKIALLAIPGVLVTGFVFSVVVGTAANLLGFKVAAAAVILIGAILASTDPAAIIPVLEHVKFKRRDAKDVVVAESALNDVVGTLLTSAFFALPLATIALPSAYASLASAGTLRFLVDQSVFGTVFGFIGFGLLWLLSGMKRRHNAHFGADQVYFLTMPVLAFVLATVFGGSGFLAAFVAGLLFHAEEHMAGIERFFFHVIDGVAKPVIFVLLGALVDLNSLIAYAPIGIAVALVFMFFVRPLMVFLMIGIYGLVPGQRGLSARELLFISFVRETGAIPAVLLVTAVARVTAPVDGLVEIGMWVILLTLVLAPPFTPWAARRLGIAE